MKTLVSKDIADPTAEAVLGNEKVEVAVVVIKEYKKEVKLETEGEEDMVQPDKVDPEKNRYPYCIVWTPIPILT
jgi:hypothetical protein